MTVVVAQWMFPGSRTFLLFFPPSPKQFVVLLPLVLFIFCSPSSATTTAPHHHIVSACLQRVWESIALSLQGRGEESQICGATQQLT